MGKSKLPSFHGEKENIKKKSSDTVDGSEIRLTT